MGAEWRVDPFGRFEQRFHDGDGWTEHVFDGREVLSDPPIPSRPTGPPATGAEPPKAEPPDPLAGLPDGMASRLQGGEVVTLGGTTFPLVVKAASVPVVVRFFAPWCPVSRSFEPVFRRSASRFAGVIWFGDVNDEQWPGALPSVGSPSVQVYPTVAGFWQGQETGRDGGSLQEAQLERKCRALAAAAQTGSLQPAVYNTIACPTCGSDAVLRIGMGRKAGAAVLFGVMSAGYAAKTFKCQRCGYTW